eukprot:CAMPEP_0167752240 /NCGR_PEP_ID=MMETSP0110_2-20121227/7025_1 /TAXON_ID=629695 /ORGANISM="Gymnochlora sp., Strain CCMP2014" /LENGTH=367 /DNA_ID=CAMNT_0007637827 /DNA_START=221 /DNA_END=1324 /DNA_ORIENTATION=-
MSQTVRKPKRAKTAYNYFQMAEKTRLLAGGSGFVMQNTTIARYIGKRWKLLSSYERSYYQRLADADKIRYNQELDVFNRRLNGLFRTSEPQIDPQKPRDLNEIAQLHQERRMRHFEAGPNSFPRGNSDTSGEYSTTYSDTSRNASYDSKESVASFENVHSATYNLGHSRIHNTDDIISSISKLVQSQQGYVKRDDTKALCIPAVERSDPYVQSNNYPNHISTSKKGNSQIKMTDSTNSLSTSSDSQVTAPSSQPESVRADNKNSSSSNTMADLPDIVDIESVGSFSPPENTFSFVPSNDLNDIHDDLKLSLGSGYDNFDFFWESEQKQKNIDQRKEEKDTKEAENDTSKLSELQDDSLLEFLSTSFV